MSNDALSRKLYDKTEKHCAQVVSNDSESGVHNVQNGGWWMGNSLEL